MGFTSGTETPLLGIQLPNGAVPRSVRGLRVQTMSRQLAKKHLLRRRRHRRRCTREEYTPDVNKVLGARAVGKGWDDLWGDCVNAWLDFEAACGYDNNGGQLTAESRPVEMTKFINTGSKWYVPPRIEAPGHREEEGHSLCGGGRGGQQSSRRRVGYTAEDAWQIGAHVGDWESERGEDWEAAVSALTELFHGLVESGELVDNMSEVRARVQKKLEALKARGTKKQPKNKKRKRVEDEEEEAEADGEETGGQASKRKKQVVPEKEKRVTRSKLRKYEVMGSRPNVERRLMMGILPRQISQLNETQVEDCSKTGHAEWPGNAANVGPFPDIILILVPWRRGGGSRRCALTTVVEFLIAFFSDECVLC
ncbi:hypothetical protein B0H13DRAFT_1863246 [Mycena leptocephala]|nr:hypothetical protein B0H13DRAFT_1863246 [Mycena leptocephala]